MRPVEHVLEQLGEVGAHGRAAAADADVAEEHLPDRQLDAVRNADEADHRAGAGDVERRLHRLAGADALERGVDADAVGQLLDRLDRRVAALGDDVGGAELRGELLAVGVAATGR